LKSGNLEKPWKTALFGDLSWKTGFLASFNDKTWKKTWKTALFGPKSGK